MEPRTRNYRETYAYLCSMLDGLPAASPDDEARRNDSAMEAVAALYPDDAFEAKLAANIVAMQLHVADTLRCAARAVNDPAEQRRCRAQATSMARRPTVRCASCSAARRSATSNSPQSILLRWNAPAGGSTKLLRQQRRRRNLRRPNPPRAASNR